MEEQSDRGSQFIDAEQWQGNTIEKLTFRDIVLSHVKKIGTYASTEFRGGYWEERMVFTGSATNMIKTYVLDTRETYSNSIEYLYDLLFPHFDQEMIQAGIKAEIDLQKAYTSNTVIVEPTREADSKETDDKEYRVFKDTADRVSYRSERVKINRLLFRALCGFLKRKDYFKGKSFEEEV